MTSHQSSIPVYLSIHPNNSHYIFVVVLFVQFCFIFFSLTSFAVVPFGKRRNVKMKEREWNRKLRTRTWSVRISSLFSLCFCVVLSESALRNCCVYFFRSFVLLLLFPLLLRLPSLLFVCARGTFLFFRRFWCKFAISLLLISLLFVQIVSEWVWVN